LRGCGGAFFQKSSPAFPFELFDQKRCLNFIDQKNTLYYNKKKERNIMNSVTSIRLPNDLRKKLAAKANIENRTLSNQIETSLRVAFIAEDNPDLPLQFIKDILQAQAEKKMGLAKPFKGMGASDVSV
jgi:hypothetical protein